MSDAIPAVVTCAGCVRGQKMCEERPCWGTPAEIKAIIDAGFGSRLMRDYWCGPLLGQHDPAIIAPAIVGCEGGAAPFTPYGRCTFLTDKQECQLHVLGLKPTEGAVACCKVEAKVNVHKAMAESWANKEAQDLAKQWEDAQ